jgi:hypothetical protein
MLELAKGLYATHGLLPVPVSGKIPMGTGWNMASIATRLAHIAAPQCTGIGIQCGLVLHPVLGWRDARILDMDIDDAGQRNAFHRAFLPVQSWRWGRRPATLLFTDPGVINREKFGPVQLLGAGKQAVWFGRYINASPLPNDPTDYWHEGADILDAPAVSVPAATLQAAIETALTAAGVPLQQKSMLLEHAKPLSQEDIAFLTPDNFARFDAEIKSMLFDALNKPTGSGRGDRFYHLGLKYGALIKASGSAQALTDAACQICPADKLIEYEITKKHAFLYDIGNIADTVFSQLPGDLGAGDKRDFARGVGMSMGLGQRVEVEKKKHALLMPTGRGYAGQTATDLMRENLPPLRFLVNRFLSDSGCIVLAGKPKVGKGWIILELALGIAEGGQFWGEQCEQGEVLLYMLEDSKRRAKERLQIMRPNGLTTGNSMRFRYSMDGPFYINADGSGSLLDDIKEHLRCFPGIRLVVVDVLQRIRGIIDKSDNAYQVDYKIIGAIQKLCAEHGVLSVVVHHTKKGKVDEAIDSINGSFGVIGAADGGIVIAREGDIMRAMSMMRDVEDFEFELTKEGKNPVWKPAQTASEMLAPGDGSKTNTVLHALLAAACQLTAGDISKRTGIPENNVATYLGRLVQNNQATRPSRGYYMAHGLPPRERIEGIKDKIKSMLLTPVSPDIEMKYAPKGAPEGARFMLLTDVTIKEIEGSFIGGERALKSLKLRGLCEYNADTVWLIGSEWGGAQHQVYFPNPFAVPEKACFKFPWEVGQ